MKPTSMYVFPQQQYHTPARVAFFAAHGAVPHAMGYPAAPRYPRKQTTDTGKRARLAADWRRYMGADVAWLVAAFRALDI